AAKNDQRLDLAGVERLSQLNQGSFSGFRGVQENHCLANIAECDVERVGDEMDRERLTLTGKRETASRIGQQIFGAFDDPVFVALRLRRERLQRAAQPAQVAALPENLG